MTRPPVRGDADWQHDDEYEGAAEYDEYDEYDDGDWVEDDPSVEYEELRPESPARRRVAIVLLGVFAVLLLIVGAAGLYVRSRLDPSGPPGDEVRLSVPTGSAVGDIADLLEDQGVVADSQIFQWYLRYKGASDFQAGDYIFRQNSAAWDALAVLRAQPLPPEFAQFTVPEGLTIREYAGAIVDDIPAFDEARIAELLASGQVRPASLPPEATSLEGFLFPDTYRIGAGQDEVAALSQMAAQFDAVAGQVGLVEGAARIGRTPYEVVIIASLIQEEYGIPEEMNKMARVIYNRLDRGEPLGIDATSRYEAELDGRDRTDIDFTSDSPYNTRRNAGLPPTPIAAPGRAALEAALNPADGPWTFYVRDPDESRTPPGGHFFTDDPDEFLEVKAECEEAGLGCG